nr:hypothetical protein [Tanacetum cinerariifolium]
FIRKDGREIFGMSIPDALLTDEIKRAPYYDEYYEHVAKYQQYLDAEHGKAEEGGATKSPKATKFFIEKQHEEEPGKTNAEVEVQSIVSVLIYQDTSLVPPMTTLVIDLMMSQSGSLLPTSTTTTTSIITTTTSLPPPPPQQSTTDPILVKRIYKSYEAHEDHKNLYDALQKSLERDYSKQLLLDLEEARQKKKKKSDLPRTPYGSPPSQPPPPPPLAGASGAPGSEAPSSSKFAASSPQSMAWTTSDTRYESAGISRTQELSPTDSLIQNDFIPVEQVHFSSDEDSGNDHLPKADLRKEWWKPLPKEERLATPKPAWTILYSNVSDVENNWATALVLTYETPAENSLLAKTRDMMNFLNWYYRQVNKTELT